MSLFAEDDQQTTNVGITLVMFISIMLIFLFLEWQSMASFPFLFINLFSFSQCTQADTQITLQDVQPPLPRGQWTRAWKTTSVDSRPAVVGKLSQSPIDCVTGMDKYLFTLICQRSRVVIVHSLPLPPLGLWVTQTYIESQVYDMHAETRAL